MHTSRNGNWRPAEDDEVELDDAIASTIDATTVSSEALMRLR
jgi:hypothetical protein